MKLTWMRIDDGRNERTGGDYACSAAHEEKGNTVSTVKPSRADYHREHQPRAEAEARRLLARKAELQGRWLSWVAQELYQLSPPEFVNMVRRELQRLS
jgi:hypothetical protein